jgi:hypothetical protein
MGRRAVIGLMAGLAAWLFGACSDDTWRERDVQGMVRCIQLGDEACVANLTCNPPLEGYSAADLVKDAQELRDVNYEHLRLVSKDMRGRDRQYTYELDGKRLYVKFCPEAVEGSIATLVVEDAR